MDAAANATGNPEQGSNAKNLFPLDAKRSIVLHSGEKSFRHFFRRITAADHEVYCSKTTLESADEDRGWSPLLNSLIANSDEARIVLYARAIERVEGYVAQDGREPEKLPNWPECIPLLHRLTAIELLFKSWCWVPDTLRLEADGRTVSFVMLGDGGELRPTTQSYGLVHRFRAPAAEHLEQFLRARSGITSALRTLRTLAAVYDELIEQVEGYSILGRELNGKEEIVREMDSVHKEIAVAGLLLPLSDSGGGSRKVKTAAVPGKSVGMKPAAALGPGGVH